MISVASEDDSHSLCALISRLFSLITSYQTLPATEHTTVKLLPYCPLLTSCSTVREPLSLHLVTAAAAQCLIVCVRVHDRDLIAGRLGRAVSCVYFHVISSVCTRGKGASYR